MKATRRGFFGMIGGVIAAAMMPKPLLALAIPAESAPIDRSYTTYLVGADAVVNYTPMYADLIRFGQNQYDQQSLNLLLVQLMTRPETERILENQGYRINYSAVKRIAEMA